MTRVKLFWNHICVLHRQERSLLDDLRTRLRLEGIDLDIRFFGLGYPFHMSEYLAREDAELPDIVVSADLEVFEVPQVFRKIQSGLYPVEDWLPLRESAALTHVRRDITLAPFVSIPLVYYTREPASATAQPLTEMNSLAIGGINNSVCKTIAKAVWERHGQAAAESLLSRCLITDMPIEAFRLVCMGKAQSALVPSLYALRADGQETFLSIPPEGPVLVSSYICARQTVPEAVARSVVKGIVSRELCHFYAQNGDLIVHPALTQVHSRQKDDRYLVPSTNWLAAYRADDFYDLYCRCLPAARRLV